MRHSAVRPVALALALCTLWPVAGQAQQPLAGVVTTVTGQAVVVRPAASGALPLKLKDSVFVRDRVETRQDSLVRVLLGGKALVTVRELSVFTITEEPGRATVELHSGKVALGVAKSLLRAGEAIEIRTPNAVAAVRGSALLVEVTAERGVPRSEFVALQATLPITVAPRADPGAERRLRANEAVSVLGLGGGATVSPVRTITLAEAQVARQLAQAPKPSQQTDKPPASVAGRISADRTREAAQLGDALTGGEGDRLGGRKVVSDTLESEISGSTFEQRQREITTLFSAFTTEEERFQRTFAQIEEVAERTLADILSKFADEPPFNPGVELASMSVPLSSTETLLTFTGTDGSRFAPVLKVIDSQVVQSGSGTVLRVDAGARVTLPGRLLSVTDSSLSTGGTLLSVGGDASLTGASGLFGLLDFTGGQVTTGAALVAVGPRAELTLARNLVRAENTVLGSGTNPSAPSPFVDLGAGAQLRSTGLSIVSLEGGSLTSSGSLLSVGQGAFVSTGGSIFAALDFQETTVTTGAELVAIQPGARLVLDQEFIAGRDAIIRAGAQPQAVKPFVSIGSGAQVTTSALSFLSLRRGSLTATGGVVSLAGGSLTSQGNSNFPFFALDETRITAGADFLSLGAGSRLSLEQPLLFADTTTFRLGGSLLALDAGAVLEPRVASALALLLLSGSVVGTDSDLIALRPGAQLALNRPLLHLADSGVAAEGRLLFLGAGASITSDELIALHLLLSFRSLFFTGGDLIRLAPAARLALNRPLLLANDSELTLGGSLLFLDDRASVSTGAGRFGFIELEGGKVTAAGPLVVIRPGATARLSGALANAFGTVLSLPQGLLSVAGGGQLSVTGSTDELVSVFGGVHSIATGTGAAMFSLAGVGTAVDAETGLTVGTDKPLQQGASLLQLGGATVSGQKVVKLDTALLEASAPLLRLRFGSTLTTELDAVDLSLKAKVTSLGPLARLDASALTVRSGALFNLAGGSFLKVNGDLVELANGSTLSLANGPVLNASGGSVVNVSGAFVAFTGTGGNTVSITNSLCPCALVSGVPVALRDGALASNVLIGPNPIRNPGLGTITLGSASTAAIVLSGAGSKVTIAAP